MSDETEERKKNPYRFQIEFVTYDPLSEAERLGLKEIISRKMDGLSSDLDELVGKSFHLTQSHGDPDE